MTEEEKALVAYRMKRAHEAIDEAKMLFDGGHINSCKSSLLCLLLCGLSLIVDQKFFYK